MNTILKISIVSSIIQTGFLVVLLWELVTRWSLMVDYPVLGVMMGTLVSALIELGPLRFYRLYRCHKRLAGVQSRVRFVDPQYREPAYRRDDGPLQKGEDREDFQ